jgi:UPF0755 protein
MIRRRGVFFWLSLGILLVALATVVGGAARSLWTPVGAGPPMIVTVEQGDSVREVAKARWQRGLISNTTALVAAAYATGDWRRIQAGRHELDAGMSALDILDALCRGSRTAWSWLTIPEGYTISQIAQQVEEKRLGSAGQFEAAARAPAAFRMDCPLPDDSLEGYLFPDTYRVDSGETEREIIAHMLRRFDEVVWKGLFQESLEYDGRSMRDIVILASLVEWEAQLGEERAKIAGVLLNRLRRGMRLECDATVQYALGDGRKSRLIYDDLDVESEYNTYLHQGLPPGPICSPGEASIRAAMEPAEVTHLYYVATSDGSHLFSNTFAAHQRAIRRARSGQ